ncbi:MAG: folate-binding protein YgfZ [Gemmatimonadales bacterium]
MERIGTTRARLNAVAEGPLVVTAPPAVFEVQGPGAIDCLQGLLTVDLRRAAAGTARYGALLTPKGMIQVDFWILRAGEGFLLVTSAAARERTLAEFRRLLPPRLARVTDRTGEYEALYLLGRRGSDLAQAAGLPRPGTVARDAGVPAGDPAANIEIAVPGFERAPFTLLGVGPRGAIEAGAERLVAAGATRGEPTDLRIAAVLAGFPTLGAELDDRTMPAEADFDAFGAVSYDKGCYVGQETVARLHFRGHANWLLRGLRMTSAAGTEDLQREGKAVARLGSVLELDDGTALALAKVRHEVAPGTTLEAPPTAVVELRNDWVT